MDKHEQHVIEYFEDAIKRKFVSINYWFQPNVDALKTLKKSGIIKDVRVGKILVGEQYKGYLFVQREGPGDCNTELWCEGKV